MQTISVEQLHDLYQKGEATIIDVRSPAEYNGVHITGAHLEPLDSLNPGEIIARYQKRPLYVVCHAGNRSQKAVEKLEQTGCSQAVSVVGGTRAWETAGFPVTRGKGVISIDRQVRIAAGSLVVLGVLIANFIDPRGVFLSAFVGLGLVFAGLTDTCGMAMLLAKMPWNRGKGASCSR